ncbi:hypothetical protein Godav_025112, partial [Gossypium davidsonii]|nr:hypothetical protein [Gossypium davidsonii]
MLEATEDTNTFFSFTSGILGSAVMLVVTVLMVIQHCLVLTFHEDIDYSEYLYCEKLLKHGQHTATKTFNLNHVRFMFDSKLMVTELILQLLLVALSSNNWYQSHILRGPVIVQYQEPWLHQVFDLWEVVNSDAELAPLRANPTVAQIRQHADERTKRHKA